MMVKEKPRLLVIGQVIHYARQGSVATHCTEGRDLGLCRAFVDLGYKVDLVTAGDEGLSETGTRLVSWATAADTSYDIALIVSIEGHWKLRGRWGRSDAQDPYDAARDAVYGWLRSGRVPVMAHMDSVYEGSGELGYAKSVGVLSAQLVRRFRELNHANQVVQFVPLAVPHIEPCDDPFPDKSDSRPSRVVYTGRVWDGQTRSRLLHLAEHADGVYEVWFTGATFQLHQPAAIGLTDDQREELFPFSCGVRFATDYTAKVSKENPHGPLRYYDVHPWLRWADVGVNFCGNADMYVVHSKIYDYLGAGCRVVTDSGAPNVGDVYAVPGGGTVVHWGAMADFTDAVKAACEIERRAVWPEIERRQRIDAARGISSWDSVARQLLAGLA